MTILKSFWFRLAAAMLVALFFNLLILFVIPPTNTLGIVVKDIASLIIGGIIYLWILRHYDD